MRIGLHLQNSTTNWPAVANTTSINKILFGAERGAEVHDGYVWYRWVGDQPLPYDNYEEHCEEWLRQFVDETFISKNAQHFNMLNEYNETLSNTQSDGEKERWKSLHTAMAKVWKENFRDRYNELSHIKLVLCETSVGNDVHLAIARAAVQYDAMIGYHPYISCNDKAPIVPDNSDSGINRPAWVSPHDWRWYSGRWNWMDEFFVANGVSVTWAFGEMGPVLDASGNWSGWLDPVGGWRNCISGDIEKYKQTMTYWLDNATRTPAYLEDRIAGGVLFTTGAPGAQWASFDLRDGDLEQVISHCNSYPYPDKVPGTPDPPPPTDPTPPATTPDGEPRVQYRREYWVVPQDATREQWLIECEKAFGTKTTVGFSYDDAGIGALENKEAILYGVPEDDRSRYVEWFGIYYPGTEITFRDLYIPEELPEMITSHPIDEPIYITQSWGENFATYMSRYGIPGHNGLDYAAKENTQVFPIADGVVILTKYDPDGYGKYIVIDHGNGLASLYAHLSRVSVEVGANVTSQKQIGLSGDTGWSSGPHLHLGLKHNGRDIDPELMLDL